MATYKFDKIDGHDVEHNVAVAFKKWAAAFKKASGGYTLHVSSGRRSTAEQSAGYLKYLRGQSGGVKWAKPSESSHCDAGPHGPVALDVRDSGADAGVTVKGTRRHDIAMRTGAAYGFEWGGWGVPDNEGWHFENRKVKPGVYSVVAKAKAALKKAVSPSTVRKGSKGALVKAVQSKLKRVYPLYAGHLVVDGVFGPATERAVKEFQRRSGLKADGIVGPATRKKLGV